MRSAILLAGVMLFVLIIIHIASWTRLAASVSVVGGSIFNAGTVPPGVAVIHRFTLVNTHPYAVGLTTALPGCACTRATASTNAIPAHGRATVTLWVEAENRIIDGSAEFRTTCGGYSQQMVLTVIGHVARDPDRLAK